MFFIKKWISKIKIKSSNKIELRRIWKKKSTFIFGCGILPKTKYFSIFSLRLRLNVKMQLRSFTGLYVSKVSSCLPPLRPIERVQGKDMYCPANNRGSASSFIRPSKKNNVLFTHTLTHLLKSCISLWHIQRKPLYFVKGKKA